MSLFYMYNSPGGLTSRKLLLLALTFTWATRLSVYLFTRNHGAPEDYRYQKFRRHYDSKGWNYWWFSFIQVFTLQGIVAMG
jgi:steroid 5-alpha reductase family enzyme